MITKMSNSPYYMCNDTKKVLIWSPKCACTTLHNYFIREICQIKDKGDARFLAKDKNKIFGNYNKIPEDYTIYFCTRNPFERIVSSFLNKFVVYLGNKLTEETLESFSKKFLEDIKVEFNDLTFNKFLQGIQELKRKNKRVDPHFNSQVNMERFNIIKNKKDLIIFDIKDINKVFNHNLSKINTTSYSGEGNINICDVPVADITPKMINLKNFESSKELVKEIYQEDYEILKY